MKKKLLTGLFAFLSWGMCGGVYAQSESDALTDLTNFIQNPDAAAETGWVINKGTGNTNTASGQHYSGDASARYFDSWNPTAGVLNYKATQTMTNLPNASYTLKFAGRNSGTKGAFVYVVAGGDTLWVEMRRNTIPTLDEAGDTVFTYAGDKGGSIWENAEEGSAEKAVNSGNGYGWNTYEISNIQVTDNNLTIGITTDSLVSGVPFDGNWFSVVDFELYGSVSVTELLEASRGRVVEYAAWLETEGHEDVSQSLLDNYESTHLIDTTSTDEVVQEVDRLNQLLSQYRIIVEGAEFVYSTTATIGDWYVSLDENNHVARANQYTGNETDVVVPESFIYNGEKYYTIALGGSGGETYTTWYYNAYNDNYHVKSVTLPATLRLVGALAMEGLRGITSVSIPSLVYHIHYGAFQGCTSLTSLNIPEKVNTLGKHAFSQCTSLFEITLPSVNIIDNYAFYGCSNLSKVKLSESLTTIGDGAFYNCSALDSLVIPANVTSIGSYFLEECDKLKYLRSEAVSAPSCSEDFSAYSLRTIYVPAGSGEAYRSATYWKNYIIVDGEGVSVKVNVETPGTIGDLILAQTEYLSDVNHLTVTGSLNDDDIYSIQNRMPNLLTIDLFGTDMTVLPDNMFYQRYALQQVVLPAGLTSIGQYAFYRCYDLQDVELPETLASIGCAAFYDCDNIKNVVIPEGVTSVGEYAFAYCNSLESIQCPSTLSAIPQSMCDHSEINTVVLAEGLTNIGNHAFYGCNNLKELVCPSTLISIGYNAFDGCTSLASVSLNEGLVTLGNDAFGNCNALQEATLPSTLTNCDSPFAYCYNLRTLSCLALIPPYLVDNDYPVYNNTIGCTLYVPAWTINKYKLTVGWDQFPIIKPLEGYWPENITVQDEVVLTLPDSLPIDYKPNVSVVNNSQGSYYNWVYGALSVSGSNTFSMGQFKMIYDQNMYFNYGINYATWYSSIVNDATMRADSVTIEMWLRNDCWAFLSFPFDVKVSDIKPINANTNFVIRKYSGADRAAMTGSTWLDMTVDSILHSGEGYIWQCSRSDANYCGFYVSAINNVNKNLIFAKENRAITLDEYQSEFSHNRSWNLIGNPYPCFYDIRAMEFTAPITVWSENNRTYYAYSPVDDEYILRPGEAFFVQRPVDQENITFSTIGRQTDRTVRDVTAVTGARSMAAPRQVFNLYLNQDSLSDRTRFVINADAEVAYETNRDASKFMSSDANVPQLFTMEGDVRFAINERPMGEGIIRLGATFGNEGTYTLSLGTTASVEVVLVDKLTGKEVNLNEHDYTFSAEAGTDLNRFEVRFNGLGTTDVEGHFAQKTTVTAVGGQIVVNGGEVANIAVYTADGKLVATATDACVAFKVANGFYVVKVLGKSYKVAVTR